MKISFPAFMLIALVAIQGRALAEPSSSEVPSPSPSSAPTLSGRWRITFTFLGVGEKNLIFNSEPKGVGSFLVLDAGPNNKPGAAPLPAVWSETTSHLISISTEIELPIGTCCRETGTLIFKAKFGPGNSMSGKAIFITGTTDEENFNGFRSMTGTFVATQMPRG